MDIAAEGNKHSCRRKWTEDKHEPFAIVLSDEKLRSFCSFPKIIAVVATNADVRKRCIIFISSFLFLLAPFHISTFLSL